MPREKSSEKSTSPFIMGNANPSGAFVGPPSQKAAAPSSQEDAMRLYRQMERDFTNSQVASAPVKTTPAAPKKATAVNRTSSPAVGSNASGAISPTAPVQPSVDEWLANDAAYKSQSDQLAKAWADYQAQSRQSENQYRTDYANKQATLSKTKDLAGQELESDFAARGLMGSGLYAKAYGDYTNDYNNRQKELDTGLSDFLANLLSQTNNYKSEQDITSEKAKQDAIARRAASLGM